MVRKEDNMEAFVKSLGFESQREFNKLVSSVDLSSSQKMTAFWKWKEDDGSKEGILKLEMVEKIDE